MSNNIGKQFEERFKLDWQNSFPDGTITRLYDSTSGYLSISTISDFICYNYPCIFFIECKAHKGSSIPFTNITQYDKMKSVNNKKGVVAGVVLWLYEKDKVLFIPIQTLIKLHDDGEKSIGLRHLDNYNIIEIPSEKLRIFMKSNYSVLMNLGKVD